MARPRKEDMSEVPEVVTEETPDVVTTQADYEQALREQDQTARFYEQVRGVPYKLYGSDCYRTDY